MISAALKIGRRSQCQVQSFPTQNACQWRDRRWVERIARALAERRFCLYTQEVVSLTTLDPKRYCEILVRLTDDEGQVIPASAFLPVAERRGLMGEIDRWVMAAVFDLLSESSQKIRDTYRFAINLSGATFYDRNYWQWVEEELTQRELTPDRLCFEIPESTILENLQAAADAIAQLQIRGYYVTVDRVGSQCRTLDYLTYLCIDYLKIADSFVNNIADDPTDLAIVEMIHCVGQLLGLQTIAKGVESEAAFRAIKALEVDYAQGCYLTRPHLLQTQFLG
ncbi:EAL domain-containing protein [Lyngbya sp. CCY1209]|uniref:EAL domain-containing protein n=1 Tax=Lyngbya sp. CCY1209 TaxID=2886103 RepID=UPI002D20E670|nr:EAL domain-containing protein [Lyngbya sp. CCY1209]MEB3883746.1 EAL domain-containing protein [Lyngbya sp. CCY1209]